MAEAVDVEAMGDAIAATPEVRTLSPCRLLVWPVAELDAALRGDAATRVWVLGRLTARLARTHASLARSLSLAVTQRLEEIFRELAAVDGRPVPGGIRIRVPISQELLAAAVGATRETVNRSIRALQAAGRVKRAGRRYTIITSSGRTDPPPTPPGSRAPPAPA